MLFRGVTIYHLYLHTCTQLTEDSVGNRRKQKKKELVNFYSWQLRESQREEVAKLRHKFQADKDRVAAMRAARRFKPY